MTEPRLAPVARAALDRLRPFPPYMDAAHIKAHEHDLLALLDDPAGWHVLKGHVQGFSERVLREWYVAKRGGGIGSSVEQPKLWKDIPAADREAWEREHLEEVRAYLKEHGYQATFTAFGFVRSGLFNFINRYQMDAQDFEERAAS